MEVKMKPGDVQPYSGDKSTVAAFGIWAEKGKMDGYIFT